jgi:F420-dependent oxidoreductase-like protein
MRFSIWPNASQPYAEVLEAARHAERTGWHAVYIADHFMVPGVTGAPVDTPTLESSTLISALAAVIPRVRIGSLVYGNTYRHPAVLANMAATADHVCAGRFILGIGAGWQENEHEQYGIRLPPVRERLDRFEEAVQVIRSLLEQPRTTFIGRHYQLTEALCEPKPVQRPLPILVGGAGERRMLRIVARYADMWNTWGRPDVIAHKSTVLDRHCAEVGRDPTAIARSAQAMVLIGAERAEIEARAAASPLPMIGGTVQELVETMGRYVESGLDEFIVPDRTLGTGNQRRDAMDLLIEQVAAPFRGTGIHPADPAPRSPTGTPNTPH